MCVGAAQASTISQDFDSLGSAGDIVNGLSFGDGTLDFLGGALVLFNANCGPDFGIACSGADDDLGSGASFGTAPQGLVLIVDEHTSLGTTGSVADPDDKASGGSVIFNFDVLTELLSITVMDIDANPTPQGVTFKFTDANGTVTWVNAGTLTPTESSANYAGDNSLATFGFDMGSISRFEVQYSGSGAIAAIEYVSAVPLPAGMVLLLSSLGAMGAMRRRKT